MNGYHLSPGVEGFWSCHMVQSKLPDPTSSFSIVPPPLNTLLVTTESPTPAPPPLSPHARNYDRSLIKNAIQDDFGKQVLCMDIVV